MNIQYRGIILVTAAFLLTAGASVDAAAKAPRSEMAQAQASCAAHNQKVRSLEAQGMSETQLKPERDAYEQACARLEALRGNLSSPASAQIAAFEAVPVAAPARAGGDCEQKQ